MEALCSSLGCKDDVEGLGFHLRYNDGQTLFTAPLRTAQPCTTLQNALQQSVQHQPDSTLGRHYLVTSYGSSPAGPCDLHPLSSCEKGTVPCP